MTTIAGSSTSADVSTYQVHLLPALVERDVALLAFSPQTPDESLSHGLD